VPWNIAVDKESRSQMNESLQAREEMTLPTEAVDDLCINADARSPERSLFDGHIFDQPPQTVERYLVQQTTSDRIVWRFNNKVRTMPANRTLRVETLAAAVIHWSFDGWRTVHDTATRDTTLGVHVCDLGTSDLCRGDRVHLTFYWPEAERWEQVDFLVCIE
jgi:glucoamylase